LHQISEMLCNTLNMLLCPFYLTTITHLVSMERLIQWIKRFKLIKHLLWKQILPIMYLIYEVVILKSDLQRLFITRNDQLQKGLTTFLFKKKYYPNNLNLKHLSSESDLFTICLPFCICCRNKVLLWSTVKDAIDFL